MRLRARTTRCSRVSNVARALAAGTALGLLVLQGVAGPAAADEQSTTSNVSQPTPPITSASFPTEPNGTAPADHDGLIPNPATPTGSAIAPPPSCSVSFDTGSGATADTVNSWIATNEDSIATTTVVCLDGTFDSPLHVWNKTSAALLVIAPEPGASAVLNLSQVVAADTDPNQYWNDSGGMSIVDSRSVEIYGLTIENYTTNSASFSPAGIYVTARSDTQTVKQSVVPHLSACYLDGGSCSDIYLFDNTVQDITNSLDGVSTVPADCGNKKISAYGVAVIGGGSSTTEALQHVVIEGNTVTGTRTGQSETVTINGDVTDFVVADNTVHDVDNIGMDTIGWETGHSQANHGLLYDNTVYDVDTYANDAYGKWNGRSCGPRPENAAGIYDDGGAYIWINDNVVWNTDQGINLDVETAGRHTNDILVSGNAVTNEPGTSTGDPSTGSEPPGVEGSSSVAGHDPYAFYVDAFGRNASITKVYVHDNVFANQSQYFLRPSDGMPVVDFGGRWSKVQLWHNTIEGFGTTDLYNPLLELDTLPLGNSVIINCDEYENLTNASNSVNGNFAFPTKNWLTLGEWQAHNLHGWDTKSAVGSFDADCPPTSIS
jgi:hypothetical protein